MSIPTEEIELAFNESASNKEIADARKSVLNSGAATLAKVADLSQTQGWVLRDDRILGLALLSRLASELSGGIAGVIESHTYAAGCLLRQLIEIEYLLFLGYKNADFLGEWFVADDEELRKNFSPQKMRKMSDGLFRDEEYWIHCSIGGHPNPKSRMLLSSYRSRLEPIDFLLPDSVHHLRRLWTSLAMTMPKLGIDSDSISLPLNESLRIWESVENSVVLKFDGIPSA